MSALRLLAESLPPAKAARRIGPACEVAASLRGL